MCCNPPSRLQRAMVEGLRLTMAAASASVSKISGVSKGVLGGVYIASLYTPPTTPDELSRMVINLLP